jgi:adenine nucleotide transporter 17
MTKSPEESISDVLARIRKRGWYTGLNAKMSKSVTQKTLYFFLFKGLSQLHARLLNGGKESSATNILLMIGYLAELVGIPVVAPLETITVQIQTGSGKESMIDVVNRVWAANGLGGFYGALDGYVIGAVQPAIQFTIYEQVKRYWLQDRAAQVLSAAEAFWLGACSKAVALTVGFPV